MIIRDKVIRRDISSSVTMTMTGILWSIEEEDGKEK